MSEIVEYLNESSQLKNEIDELKLRYQQVRDQIYNYLVNSGVDHYSDENFSVVKTEDSDYLDVTKKSLLTALSQAHVTDQQKQEILAIAFQSKTKSGGIQIRPKQ
jgi:hypothetical protein